MGSLCSYLSPWARQVRQNEKQQELATKTLADLTARVRPYLNRKIAIQHELEGIKRRVARDPRLRDDILIRQQVGDLQYQKALIDKQLLIHNNAVRDFQNEQLSLTATATDMMTFHAKSQIRRMAPRVDTNALQREVDRIEDGQDDDAEMRDILVDHKQRVDPRIQALEQMEEMGVPGTDKIDAFFDDAVSSGMTDALLKTPSLPRPAKIAPPSSSKHHARYAFEEEEEEDEVDDRRGAHGDAGVMYTPEYVESRQARKDELMLLV